MSPPQFKGKFCSESWVKDLKKHVLGLLRKKLECQTVLNLRYTIMFTENIRCIFNFNFISVSESTWLSKQNDNKIVRVPRTPESLLLSVTLASETFLGWRDLVHKTRLRCWWRCRFSPWECLEIVSCPCSIVLARWGEVELWRLRWTRWLLCETIR